MELDIYLPSSVPTIKDKILQDTCEIVVRFFNSNKNNVEAMVTTLNILAKNNIEAKHDYCWLYEEKCAIFQSIVQKLTEQFLDLLEKDSATQKISIREISLTMASASVWFNFRPPLEPFLQGIENRFQVEEALSTELSFQCLDSIIRLVVPLASSKDSLKLKGNKLRADLFLTLTQEALPLFLQEDPPLKFDSVKELTKRRIFWLRNLLSHGEFSAGDIQTYSHVLEELKKRENDLSVELKDILLKEPRKTSTYREGEKTFFDLDSTVKYTKILRAQNNPKGLQWYLLMRAEEILRFLGQNITFPVKDIQVYLKVLRHCVWDISIFTLNKTISKLCKEVVSDSHLKDVDYSLAIDLLRLNMIFSVILNDKHIAYFVEEQQKLFKKILNSTINEEQARALFEIKTLRWHGGIPFNVRLASQMEQHFEKFSKGSSPSQIERIYYLRLYENFPVNHKIFLKPNFICDRTGYEIDIAYVGEKRIAIHIDGSPHFEPITHQKTAKTIFRNQCLAEAGWISLAIDITDYKEPLEKVKDVVLKFEKLLKEDKEELTSNNSSAKDTDEFSKHQSRGKLMLIHSQLGTQILSLTDNPKEKLTTSLQQKIE